jgi:hypothetical protein
MKMGSGLLSTPDVGTLASFFLAQGDITVRVCSEGGAELI